jgi:hypothetical protein
VKSVLIAYEDQYFEALHGLVRALRRDRGLPGICLEPRSVRGTGGFVNEVPRLLRMSLKQTKLPPDRVVCVADADKPRNLVPGAAPLPAGGDRDAVERWVRELEMSFWDLLVREAHLPEAAAARLCVVCIRWSKESLLVASPDALLDYASRRDRRAPVGALLRGCVPCPTTLPDEELTLRYRTPGRCMDTVFSAIEGCRYKKGRDDGDLLRAQIAPHQTRRAQVLSRCLDLGRLLGELG